MVEQSFHVQGQRQKRSRDLQHRVSEVSCTLEMKLEDEFAVFSDGEHIYDSDRMEILENTFIKVCFLVSTKILDYLNLSWHNFTSEVAVLSSIPFYRSVFSLAIQNI